MSDVRDDLLTWQSIRQLADCEALTPVLTPHKVLLTSMVADRPQITWPHQYHWFAKAQVLTPPTGAVVYARAAWEGLWRKDLLRRLLNPVVLVSTFYDKPVRETSTTAMFADGSPVSRWFGVQAMTTHPQFTAMPLGVKARMAPMLKAGERRETRDILCYCNFAYLRVGRAPDPIRQAVWEQFSGLPWVTTKTVNKDDTGGYISDLGRSKFVLSPPGLGYDCYRTYEAIAMGAIPIVLRNKPITDVCESLPVLLVNDWSEVTPERLSLEWQCRHWGSSDTLTLTYWRKQFAHAAAACRQGVLA